MSKIEIGSGRRIWRVDAQAADLSMIRGPLVVEFPAYPQKLRIDVRRTAMLIIDMQNDFCAPGGWLERQGVDIAPARRPIPVLRALLPLLRAHSMPVIWLNWGNRPDKLNLHPGILHVYNPTGDGVGLGDSFPGGESRTLEKNSWGAALVEELEVLPGDICVDKYRMSGFFDTPLDSILRNLEIRSLLFGGVNLDQCVLSTLTDAACLGYDCIVVEDCCATTSPDYCRQATLYNVPQCFGFVTSSRNIQSGFERERITDDPIDRNTPVGVPGV